jgi:hypothetical protein
LHLGGDGAKLIAVVVLAPQVSARMGTSSMERALMSGCETPGGMRSKFE